MGISGFYTPTNVSSFCVVSLVIGAGVSVANPVVVPVVLSVPEDDTEADGVGDV